MYSFLLQSRAGMGSDWSCTAADEDADGDISPSLLPFGEGLLFPSRIA